MRETQTIHAARHRDACEQQSNIRSGFQNGYSFVGITCLERHETGVLHDIDGEGLQKRIMFDDQNNVR
jgi:hypothetical protein